MMGGEGEERRGVSERGARERSEQGLSAQARDTPERGGAPERGDAPERGSAPERGGTREYYDRNTRSFLRPWRGSRGTGAIHRPLWAPGVRNRTEALHYIHGVIADILVAQGVVRRRDDQQATSEPDGARNGETGAGPLPLLADLGCGVGATLEQLYRLLQADLAGVTLSTVQAAIARDRSGATARIVAGDFMDKDVLTALRVDDTRPLDGAWMIESFVHAADIATLLKNVAEQMRGGGILIIVDDLVSDDYTIDDAAPRHRRWINEFRNGWHVKAFLSPNQVARQAATAGFTLVEQRDLSGYVRNEWVRGMHVHIAATLARLGSAESPAWSNLRGGSALQHLGRHGIVRYQVLVFRRD